MDSFEWFQIDRYALFDSGSRKGITRSISVQVTAFTIVLTYLLYSYYQRWLRHQSDKAFAEQHGCLPMESRLPYKWPFALDILKRQYDALPSQRLLAFQSQYFDKVGQNMTFDLFGNTGYMTTDPKNIEAILCTNFKDYGMGSRRPGLFPMLGEGIFTQDGRPWKHSREMLRRQFARMNYQTMSAFDEPIDRLVVELSSANGVVDLQPAFFRFTLATTTALIFGEPVAGLDDDDQDTFSKSFDHASLVSAIRLRLADFCWAYSPSTFKQSCATVKRYANHFVQQALKDMEVNGEEALERHLFILDLYKELEDPILVRDQLVHVLIAGRDTTACLLSWTFYCLVRHPDVLQRLRREIQSMTESPQGLTRAQILKLPYLKCVINETLRLYPQLPVNVRVATKTTMLPRGGGPNGQSPVLIPRGTGIGYSVYHMHRHSYLYGEDAAEYKPERWENSKLAKIGPGFMPFHAGPRLCLGKDFALTEASFAIVRIIQAFPNLRLPPDASLDPIGLERQSLTIVVSSADGCKVLLE